MKRGIGVLIILLAIAATLAFLNAPVSPTGMHSLSPKADIANCNTTILADSTLGSNLTANGTNCVNFGADNIELDCRGFTITGDGTTIGINSSHRTNITIKNCIIINFNASIVLFDTNNSLVENNIVLNSANDCLMVNGNNNTIANNTLRISNTTDGFDFNDSGIFVNYTICMNRTYVNNTVTFDIPNEASYSANETVGPLLQVCPLIINSDTNITNNMTAIGDCVVVVANDVTLDCKGFTITGDGTGAGVLVLPGSINTTIRNCNIDNFAQDIRLDTSDIHNISNNNLTNATNASLFMSFSTIGTVTNNYIHTQGTTGLGAIWASNAAHWRFNHNVVSAPQKTAINWFTGKGNNSFNNTIVESGRVWMNLSPKNAPVVALNGKLNFTNTTFRNGNGSIRVIPTVTVPDTNGPPPFRVADQNNLLIVFNRTYMNTTNLTWLNTTSQITFNGLPFAGTPTALVDLKDNGTYVTCNAPRCTNKTYAGGTFSMQVTGFTTYAIRGVAAPPPPPGGGGVSRGGGGGSSTMASLVILPEEEKKQETAQKPKIAEPYKKEEAVVQEVYEKPETAAATKISLNPAPKEKSTNFLSIISLVLALLLITVLAIMIFRKIRNDPDRVEKRIEEIRRRIEKLR
ncbi:hypothetical protein KY329_05750 [Candidatus Woesearchaeota archaeon]|nr:hypothetical protein [Candidatus Woesearchaeota archaeon]